MSIKLNVSGKIFLIEKETLCKSQLFDNMFKDCDTVSDEIMIYRSPMLFDHVYAYLLDDTYPYPKKYDAELDYYLIDKPFRRAPIIYDRCYESSCDRRKPCKSDSSCGDRRKSDARFNSCISKKSSC